MNYAYLTSRSVTYAQKMERALRRSDILARIERPEREITEKGCAYAVVVSETFLPEAMEVLRYNGLFPVKVVARDEDGYREIRI